METAEQKKETSRAIIQSVCFMLRYGRKNHEVFTAGIKSASADSYVLLSDATKIYCESISTGYGEPHTERWSPGLPELLFVHPERCEETLSLLEKRNYLDMTPAQFAAG